MSELIIALLIALATTLSLAAIINYIVNMKLVSVEIAIKYVTAFLVTLVIAIFLF